ncbi:DNA repair protein [Sparassis crispa]|uniref:DNA repair protein n=1 Tax=Sparassis crispa TaxID=139825 RepID=A0A401H0M9_9APHY|nr:DNA repair protein [Sparassis crispa]GBE87985.1 DNA repair protein [Sparassis crispa]
MGVKSLWSLLDPVGRPVLLETMEGKAMAIDSSIWIYQFQATMRDKEGRGLVNAHVLGFLRRICKLLFYGIQPVFVFDGGAPTLKRATIAERKKKKSGAAISHAKLAERLLAAQMRREALCHVQAKSSDGKGKGKAPAGPVTLDENTVYLEDLDENTPRTPPKKVPQDGGQPSPPSSKKKSRWQDHDPYKLPEVNLEDVIAKATRSSVPDPRLATEEELSAFIEEMRPEDFDVTSPAFHELPTEVKYEIVGDLRLKSRQTSYKRLQNMLRNAKTPLDFSKEQIKNLKQRNSLTQQLLVTTDSIGKAHVQIPIRIASERNREYLLVKNEGEGGGWVLGIRDEGTQSKPIEIDQNQEKVEEKEGSDDDENMEEVDISAKNTPYDLDLRELRRGQALTALAKRYTPKKLAPLTTKIKKPKPRSQPLFAPDEDEEPAVQASEDDGELSLAIQQSLVYEEESNLRRALEASRSEMASSYGSNIGASTSSSTSALAGPSTPPHHASTSRIEGRLSMDLESDDDDMYASPTRLETALSIGGAGPLRRPLSHAAQPMANSPSSRRQPTFGVPTLLLPRQSPISVAPHPPPAITVSDSEDDMEEVPVPPPSAPSSVQSVARLSTAIMQLPSPPQRPRSPSPLTAPLESDSDDDMQEVLPSVPAQSRSQQSADTAAEFRPTSTPATPLAAPELDIHSVPPRLSGPSTNRDTGEALGVPQERSHSPSPALQFKINYHSNEDEGASGSENENERWSRSPSPTTGPSQDKTAPAVSTAEGWDPAEEMDPQAEEGEFARFISQVKGRDLDTVRREIDDEISALNQQKKVAMRDSEDITQQMISQIMIMLRLFGIPYITAPMEAEAQCAELLALNLVDGIITDDSDVFLFGGMRVLKNMFNQSKTVECFLLPDLERELGLDRDKLIRLAYLLGSDYTDGLPGVGPVVAMELLKEFPGQDGLHKFKDWWQKIQSGRDKPEDTQSKFRKRFKKRFKELYLPDDWPNAAVRDAYHHPTVDESEEPFKWGLPDLDALRHFFNSELGWSPTKVDDLLLPIIHKMGKRGQSSAMNKQGNLNSFFDVPIGGAHAPRKRQAYGSKRLQDVLTDFRKKRDQAERVPGASADSGEESAEKPAKKRKTNGAKVKGKERTARGKTARGGKARKSRKRKQSTAASEEDQNDQDAVVPAQTNSPPPLSVNLRPRPKPKPAYKEGITEPASDDGDIDDS